MTPIRILAPTLAAACVALLAGCTSFPVETDYDPAVDFATLQTYAWIDGPPKTGDPRLDNDLLARRIRRAIDTQLAAKGYREAESGAPDFEVTYLLGVERQVDVQTYVDTYPRGYRWYPGPSQAYTTVREYDVGSLVIDVVDPRKKQLIWRGSTEARLQDDGTPEERDARANAAVSAILDRFPPQ
jgi:hypothetical protein